MPKSLRCRELLKRVRQVDRRFVVAVNRGKGSHRMLILETEAGKRHYPFPCHNDGAEIGKHYLKDIIAYFDLPAGIFD